VQAAADQGRSLEVSGGQPTGPAEPRLPAVQESAPTPAAAAAPQGTSPAAGQQQDVKQASISVQEPRADGDKLQHFAGRCAYDVARS